MNRTLILVLQNLSTHYPMLTFLMSASIKDLTRALLLLHFNMQTNQSFFAFCFSTSKDIGSTLLSVLQPVKSSLVTFSMSFRLENINYSFLGALKPLNNYLHVT